jgi:hypothetical protein
MPEFVVDAILAGVAIVVAIAIGLVILDAVALTREDLRAQAVAPRPMLSRAARLRRLAVVAVVVAIVAAAGAGFQVIEGDSLLASGPADGSGSLYLGTAPTTYRGPDDLVFAAVPGGDIQVKFSLVNTGAFPLTVTTMNEPLNGSSVWEADGYFASGSVAPAGQPSDGATHRFEIPPHATVPVVAHLHLRKCRPSTSETGATPSTPTPAGTPSAWAAVTAEAGGFMSFGSLSIAYEMLGMTHTSTVALPANLVMIDANSVLCPSAAGSPPTNYP